MSFQHQNQDGSLNRNTATLPSFWSGSCDELGWKSSLGGRPKATKDLVDGGLEEHEATEVLFTMEELFLGLYSWRVIAFGMPNSLGCIYSLCVGVIATVLKSALFAVVRTRP